MRLERALKATKNFFDDETGRFEIMTGTVITFFGAFLAGVSFLGRDWLYAALHLAIAITAYRMATAHIERRAALRTLRNVRAEIERDRTTTT